jgi:hypothetical protein
MIGFKQVLVVWSADDYIKWAAPDRLVLAETQKIDKEEQALQDLIKSTRCCNNS